MERFPNKLIYDVTWIKDNKSPIVVSYTCQWSKKTTPLFTSRCQQKPQGSLERTHQISVIPWKTHRISAQPAGTSMNQQYLCTRRPMKPHEATAEELTRSPYKERFKMFQTRILSRSFNCSRSPSTKVRKDPCVRNSQLVQGRTKAIATACHSPSLKPGLFVSLQLPSGNLT